MKQLEDMIKEHGRVKAGNILKVDSFLNHRVEPGINRAMSKEIARLYGGCGVSKILTVESSGIPLAAFTADAMGVPFVFAKKNRTKNIAGDVWRAEVLSYTTGNTYEIVVSKDFLGPKDRVLVVDDFLARGCALRGLLEIIRSSGAELVGCAIAVEKGFQDGGKGLRAEGVRIESLAVIESMSEEGGVVFAR